MGQNAKSALVIELKGQMARLEGKAGAARTHKAVPFGLKPMDAHLPGGGIAQGSLHEMFSGGPDVEQGAAATLLIAGLLARTQGTVLWALDRRDLFAPALAGVGLHPDRVIFAEAGKPAAVLAVMEEGLRATCLAGVVGELRGPLTLTASRRLQLAAETSGVAAFALRRSRRHDDPVLTEPSAAVTRWRITALPAPAPLQAAPDTPGVGRARWQLDLLRCRGTEPATWIVEACDAQGRLRLATNLADRPAAPRRSRSGAASKAAIGHRAA